ncbi:hypothetical protein INR49_017536 [Caranx melampygus]|nr:hypothetical protein INR49_017536 [Caranx melampygus]
MQCGALLTWCRRTHSPDAASPPGSPARVYLRQYYRVLFSTGMSLIRRGSPRRVRTFNIRIFFSVSAHRYPHRSSVAQLIASLSDSLPVLWPNWFLR